MPFTDNKLADNLDNIDRRILTELQQDGRLSNVELARRVGLSPTPCLARVKRLESIACIKGYTALIDPAYVSAGLLVFVEIRLTRTAADVFTEFREAVVQLPDILECHLVSGDFDYLIKARVADMPAYRVLLGETLLTLPGVAASRTYVVMEEVKQTTVLPVPIRKRQS